MAEKSKCFWNRDTNFVGEYFEGGNIE